MMWWYYFHMTKCCIERPYVTGKQILDTSLWPWIQFPKPCLPLLPHFNSSWNRYSEYHFQAMVMVRTSPPYIVYSDLHFPSPLKSLHLHLLRKRVPCNWLLRQIDKARSFSRAHFSACEYDICSASISTLCLVGVCCRIPEKRKYHNKLILNSWWWNTSINEGVSCFNSSKIKVLKRPVITDKKVIFFLHSAMPWYLEDNKKY